MNISFLSKNDKRNFLAIGLTAEQTNKLIDALKLQFEHYYEFNQKSIDLLNEDFKASLMQIYNIPFEQRQPILIKVDQVTFDEKNELMCELLSESKPLQVTFFMDFYDFSTLNENAVNCILGNISTFVINFENKNASEFALKYFKLDKITTGVYVHSYVDGNWVLEQIQ